MAAHNIPQTPLYLSEMFGWYLIFNRICIVSDLFFAPQILYNWSLKCWLTINLPQKYQEHWPHLFSDGRRP